MKGGSPASVKVSSNVRKCGGSLAYHNVMKSSKIGGGRKKKSASKSKRKKSGKKRKSNKKSSKSSKKKKSTKKRKSKRKMRGGAEKELRIGRGLPLEKLSDLEHFIKKYNTKKLNDDNEYLPDYSIVSGHDRRTQLYTITIEIYKSTYTIIKLKNVISITKKENENENKIGLKTLSFKFNESDIPNGNGIVVEES